MRSQIRHIPLMVLLAGLFGAAAASAADLKVYGVLDNGFTLAKSKGADSTFQMTAGNYAGSRFGLWGSESLENGVSVNFILEEGYASDTGAFSIPNEMFGRESHLWIKGPWGQVGFGRVGGFSTGSTSLSWYWDMDPFDTGYIDAGNQATQLNVWRVNNNVVYYVTPEMNGWKAGLQYSLSGQKLQETNKFSDNDSWANAAVRWDGSVAKALLGIEWERFGAPDVPGTVRRDDAWNVKGAFVWTPDAGSLSLFLSGSWFKNQRRIADSTWDDDGKIAYRTDSGEGLEAASLAFGARYTLGSNDFMAQAQYMDGKNKAAAMDAEDDFSRTVLSAGVHHHFSKRTFGYLIASWADGDGFLNSSDCLTNRWQGHVGIFHRF